MSRAAIVRGIQLIVAITLATFAYLLYDGIQTRQTNLAVGFSNIRPFWLVVAAICALQEGVCGGLRIFALGRVLWPSLKLRTAIISEFVLMFCAGVTPAQAGAAVSQVAVLVHGGMRLADVATAEVLTMTCTVLFFLLTAFTIVIMRATGMLVVDERRQIDWLLTVSTTIFGAGFIMMVIAVVYPPLLKGIIRWLAVPQGAIVRFGLRQLRKISRFQSWADTLLARRGHLTKRLLLGVDDFYRGFRIYLKRGKAACLIAFILTFGFFCSRFAVAYFILLGLGIPTTPSSFVAIGPPIVQVVLIQGLLNFALYLSPTPGASGIAETGSNTLMSPWVKGAFELPYLVLWRLLALFLCMFVGGIYVFRYLGTDVLEDQIKRNKQTQDALQQERLSRDVA